MITNAFYKTRNKFTNLENENYALFLYWLNLAYKILNIQLFLRKFLNEIYDII